MNKRRAEIVHDHSYREGLSRQYIKLPIHEAYPAQKLYVKAITKGLNYEFKELKLYVCGYERIHSTIKYKYYDPELGKNRFLTPAEVADSKTALRTYFVRA